MRKNILLGMMCSLACPFVHAQGTVNMTTTAVPFLRINPDARGGGMGETGIATTPDAGSAFYNLAKTPFTGARSGGSLDYTPWLRDIAPGMYLVAASGYHRFDTAQALSASVRYFSLGNVPVSDFQGNLLETSSPREYSLDMGYSRKLSDNLALGLAVRYIHSHLASGSVDGTAYQAGSAVAADLSFFYSHLDDEGRGFSGGLVLSNLGTKIAYTSDAARKDYLPANLGLGLAYTFVMDENNSLLLGVDANKLLVPSSPLDSAGEQQYYNYSLVHSWIQSFNNAGISLAGGAEYSYSHLFFLRAGYYYEDKSRGGQDYLTVGVGLHYSIFTLNWSYLAPSASGVGRSPLANTYRFGLLIN